jgi:hypothetical protein
MTYAEAEETVKKANEGPWRNSEELPGGVVYGKKAKKERPTGKCCLVLITNGWS